MMNDPQPTRSDSLSTPAHLPISRDLICATWAFSLFASLSTPLELFPPSRTLLFPFHIHHPPPDHVQILPHHAKEIDAPTSITLSTLTIVSCSFSGQIFWTRCISISSPKVRNSQCTRPRDFLLGREVRALHYSYSRRPDPTLTRSAKHRANSFLPSVSDNWINPYCPAYCSSFKPLLFLLQ